MEVTYHSHLLLKNMSLRRKTLVYKYSPVKGSSFKGSYVFRFSTCAFALLEKGQFSFQSQRKAMPKNVQATTQLHSSHTLAKLCSKFSKSGFNSTWSKNFQMFKLYSEKAEEPEIKLPTFIGSSKKTREFPKKHLLFYWLHQSLWLCGSQQTVEHSSRVGNTKPPYLPPEKSVCRSRSNS